MIVSEVAAKIIEDIGVQSDPEMIAILNDNREVLSKCEREMVLRTTRKGTNAGGKFWGCWTVLEVPVHDAGVGIR